MSSGAGIPWAQAFEMARQVSEAIAPVVAESKCVGSVRRRRPTVGDIEFCARPLMVQDLLGESTPDLDPLRKVLREIGTWVKGDERQMAVTDLFGVPGVKLELYVVFAPAAWGSIVAIRTGPADLGAYVMRKMRDHRVRHVHGHAEDLVRGYPIPTDTEEQFFKLVNLPCVPPRERDALADKLIPNRGK